VTWARKAGAVHKWMKIYRQVSWIEKNGSFLLEELGRNDMHNAQRAQEYI
jgi:hypothetical protein